MVRFIAYLGGILCNNWISLTNDMKTNIIIFVKWCTTKYLNYSKLNNRLFGQWSFRTLNLAAPRIQEFTTNEPIDVVVSLFLSTVALIGTINSCLVTLYCVGILYCNNIVQLLFHTPFFYRHCPNINTSLLQTVLLLPIILNFVQLQPL